MSLITFGTTGTADITAFEKRLGFFLPDDYKRFLLECNGCSFGDNNPYLEVSKIGKVFCDALFGLKLNNSLDLEQCHDDMDSEIHFGTVLIGTDILGGLFALSCIKDNEGVYYYDHSYNFPTSDDEENTYYITSTFGRFANFIGI